MLSRKIGVIVAGLALVLGGAAAPAQAVVTAPAAPSAAQLGDPSGLGAGGRLVPPVATKANSTEMRSTKVVKGLKHSIPAKSGGVSTQSIPTSGYLYDFAQETPAVAQSSISGNVLGIKPVVGAQDHSLFEVTMQGGTGNRQVMIEAGTAVEPVAFAGSANPYNPHFFASIWVNNTWCGSYVGNGTCSAGGGTWVNYNDTIDVNLGDDLVGHVGTAKKIALVHATNGCGGTIPGGEPGTWVYYNTSYVGCFQDKIWTSATPAMGSMTTLPFFQAFWEGIKGVVGSGTCLQLGNGVFPTTTTSPTAYVGSLSHATSGGSAGNFSTYGATYPTQFGMLALSAANASFRGGGTETVPC